MRPSVSQSTQKSLRFPTVDGLSVRGAFDDRALSSDFGPMILRGIDRQMDLTEHLGEKRTHLLFNGPSS